MIHVTEKNVSLLDVDLLISECIKANRGEASFVYVISPFMTNYKIPTNLIGFASNIIRNIAV